LRRDGRNRTGGSRQSRSRAARRALVSESAIEIVEAGEKIRVFYERRFLTFVGHCATFIPESCTTRDFAHGGARKQHSVVRFGTNTS